MEEKERERQVSGDEMKCKCLNEPLRNCWSTFQHELEQQLGHESTSIRFLINDVVTVVLSTLDLNRGSSSGSSKNFRNPHLDVRVTK